MRYHSSISILSLMFLVCSFQHAKGSSGKCSSSNSYECPSEACGGTILVSDCLDCDGYLSTDDTTKVCFDRKIFNAKENPSPSYLWYDILGAIIWFLTAGVATACGVGGGGVYVPLGILLLNFAPKPSSGLSQASIFGASVGGLILNLQNRHPLATKIIKSDKPGEKNDTIVSVPHNDKTMKGAQSEENTEYYTRPLIDYDMALFLSPMTMAGAVMGVMVQKILPNWLYLALAALILGYTAKKTFGKYFDARAKEKKATQNTSEAKAVNQESDETSTPQTVDRTCGKDSENNDEEESSSSSKNTKKSSLLSEENEEQEGPEKASPKSHEAGEQETDSVILDEEKIAKRKYFMEQDSRQLPAEKLFALFVLWVGLVLLTFFKGGKGVDSIIGITCASPWYGSLIAIQFLWTIGFSALFGYKLYKTTNEKISVGYKFHSHDVIWDFSKLRFYAFFTFIAGIVAGLVGIGGGMVLGPLMIIMGIHPSVSSATNATMVVLTSSSVAVLFVTAGLVPWEYAVTFFFICFVGAYIGKVYIDGYVKRTGKASLLIFLLATIIALATVGCLITVFTRLADSEWCFEGFNKFCNLPAEDEDEDRCEVHRLLFGAEHDF